ncbi:MAG: hypothetical protein ACXWQQ_08605 [Pseudobdellovibrio sp.]
MKKALIFSLLPLLFSCAIVSKHGDQTNAEPTPTESKTPVAATPAPATPAPTVKSLTKTITDEDFKNRGDDKELKKRIVVLPFIDKKGIRSKEVLAKAQEAFMDVINQNGDMIALDSSVLKLDLQKYIKNGYYDLKGISQASNKVGISSLLEGRVVDMRFKNEDPAKVDNSSSLKMRSVSFEIVVQARLFNTHSEQELLNTVKTVTVDDPASQIPENITSDNFFSKNTELTELLIKDAFFDFNAKLVDALKLISWEGRIAALQGEKIYLNVGKISGVQLGDILKVVEDSNEIYDPELGYHVGKVQGKVKGTLEIVGFFGQDGAISVVHSGAGFKENDRVEIYQ